MAIDTADKRASVLNVGLPTKGLFSAPSGSIGQASKMCIVMLYVGIAVSTFLYGIVWLTPTLLTVGANDAWTDVDVSSLVPTTATGVILHVENIGGSDYAIGYRNNGSTDNRTNIMLVNSHLWAAVGVTNRVFEAYIDLESYQPTYLVGYFQSESAFFTNGVSKTVDTASWTDIDISGDTGTDTAIGGIFEITDGGGAETTTGIRKNGSTDNRFVTPTNHKWCMSGVDGTEICEGYGNTVPPGFFLLGYIKHHAFFYPNAIDKSISALAVWTDLATLPGGATGGFIEVLNGDSYFAGLRKDGSSETDYYLMPGLGHGFVECSTSQIIEGKISNTGCDFFLMGYSYDYMLYTAADSFKLSDSTIKLLTINYTASDIFKLSDSVVRFWLMTASDIFKLSDITTGVGYQLFNAFLTAHKNTEFEVAKKNVNFFVKGSGDDFIIPKIR